MLLRALAVRLQAIPVLSSDPPSYATQLDLIAYRCFSLSRGHLPRRRISPRHRRQSASGSHFVNRSHAVNQIRFFLLEFRLTIGGGRVVRRKNQAARGIEQRHELLVELLIAAAQSRKNRQ